MTMTEYKRTNQKERALSEPFPQDGFVTAEQIAVFVGVHTKTVWDWCRPARKILPSPIRISQGVTRWRALDIRRALDMCAAQAVSKGGNPEFE